MPQVALAAVVLFTLWAPLAGDAVPGEEGAGEDRCCHTGWGW